MALNEIEQISEVIKKSNHVLITFRKDFSVDAVASALALYLILKKQNKLVDIVCSDFELAKTLQFLPESKKIKSAISNLQKFVIDVDIAKDKIEEFSYNAENNKLKIFITPKSGLLSQEDLSASNSEYKYDLIITIDTPDLESLGKIYQNSTDFFYHTSIINIDHSAENEHFGQINLTNMNAVANTEILYHLINDIDKNLLDAPVATCLLTGMISKTRSFKTNNVTPQTLQIAGNLINAGAEKEAIIKSLYRSRSLATLNLWGRVLARLKSDNGNKLIWSLITEHDFIQANADKADLPDVIDELISFIPSAEIVVIIYQLRGINHVIVNTLKNDNALYLTSSFNPSGSKKFAEFSFNDISLQEAENTVIGKIKERLGQN